MQGVYRSCRGCTGCAGVYRSWGCKGRVGGVKVIQGVCTGRAGGVQVVQGV